ncbi:single-stranded DNA-binding protein [Acetobacter nitrogenifigens]|nr:single-stranded DNA-binding protein [Acetobacter nitrogenifigens]
MSGSVNRVILIGNLGADPVLATRDDIDMRTASFPLATSESWSDSGSGRRKQKREWHQVVCLDARVVRVVEHGCRKGAQVMIEGRLRTREWTDEQGVRAKRTEIVIDGPGCDLRVLEPARGGRPTRDRRRRRTPYADQ